MASLLGMPNDFDYGYTTVQGTTYVVVRTNNGLNIRRDYEDQRTAQCW